MHAPARCRRARSPAGNIRFRGQDITEISERDLRASARRGDGHDLPESARRAQSDPRRRPPDRRCDYAPIRKISASEARAQALELLRAVKIRDPEKRMAAYPHELSGGMCQRVDDRHGDLQQSGAADRRRADHRPRRHDAKGGDGPSDRDRRRARHGDHPDHPRSRSRRPLLSPRRGDGTGQAGRGGRRRRRSSGRRSIPTPNVWWRLRPPRPRGSRIWCRKRRSAGNLPSPVAPPPQPAPGTPPLLEVQNLAKRFDRGQPRRSRTFR